LHLNPRLPLVLHPVGRDIDPVRLVEGKEERQHTSREEHAPITCDTPIRRCAAVVGVAGAGKPEWGEVMRVVRLS